MSGAGGYTVGPHRMFEDLWCVYRPNGWAERKRSGKSLMTFRDPSDALACALKLNRKIGAA